MHAIHFNGKIGEVSGLRAYCTLVLHLGLVHECEAYCSIGANVCWNLCRMSGIYSIIEILNFFVVLFDDESTEKFAIPVFDDNI